MDFKKLAEDIGLDEDDFLEIVDLFIESTPSDLSRLESAADEGHAQSVVETAHSIKGASGNLGFQDMYHMARDIEMNAREDVLEGAKETIRSLKEQFSQIEKAVRSLTKSPPENGG
jgi:HPt (histidine-containing phosphotransfer) domain-containing protein